MSVTQAPPVPVQLACPKCGSTSITSWESCEMAYFGVRFFASPSGDGTVIVDYDDVYDTETGDGGEYANDLWCRDCNAHLTETDLVPESAGFDPQWKPTPVPAPPARPSDSDVLDRIHKMLDVPQWTAGVEMLEWIASAIVSSGRPIKGV